ncbi:hypothetical protein [Thermobifida halotolerans]|uniref:hypothetical protein n=1 Tax=Thermobifida halotolerans TaxID=483545 RepID=UPI001F22AE66|nr:hypothetical protein [Thermobifida halotolerans]
MGKLEGFVSTAEGPVRYVRVARSGEILGYLWYSDTEHAAAFEPRRTGGDAPYNAAVAWTDELRRLHRSGLTPSQAAARLAKSFGGSEVGRIVPGSEAHAANSAELRRLAES